MLPKRWSRGRTKQRFGDRFRIRARFTEAMLLPLPNPPERHDDESETRRPGLGFAVGLRLAPAQQDHCVEVDSNPLGVLRDGRCHLVHETAEEREPPAAEEPVTRILSAGPFG